MGRNTGIAVRAGLMALLGCAAGLAVAQWLHFGGGYRFDYDEGVYLACGALARDAAIFTEVFSSQPPLLLEVLKHLVHGGAEDVLLARGCITACALVTLFATVWLAVRRAGWLAGICTLLFLASSFRWQMQSRTVQAELPALACISIAIVLASLRRGRGPASAAAGVAFALAVLFKLLAVPFAPGLVWLVAGERTAEEPVRGRAMRMLFFSSAATLTLATISLRYDLSALKQQAIQLHFGARLVAAPPWSLFAQTLQEDPFFWLGALCAIPVLAVAGKRGLLRDLLLLALPPLGFILWNRPFFPHHLVVLVPAAALLVGAALAVCLEWIAQRRRAGAIAATALLALVACARIPLLERSAAEMETARLNDDDLRAIARLGQVLSPGEPLVTDDQFLGFLAGHLPPPKLCDTSSVRMSSLPLGDALIESSESARAVMFWTNRLNTSPVFVSWAEQRFPRREELGPGRRLLWRAAGQ